MIRVDVADRPAPAAAKSAKVKRETVDKAAPSPLASSGNGKRTISRAVTPDADGASAQSLNESPSKTRVKPSDRAVPMPVNESDGEDAVAEPTVFRDVVFTDDEDFVSVSMGADHVEDDSDEVDGEMNKLVDDEAEEEQSGEDETASDVDGEEEVDGDEEFEVVRKESVPVVVSRDEPTTAVAVVRKKRTKADEALDKMETEREMFMAAKKRSVASIAKTNPGDGTKRLYGEESYIHDDIVDSPVAPPGRARVVLPVTPTKPRYKKTATLPVAPVQSSPVLSVGGEEVILLSDTDPRGEQGPAECEVTNPEDMDPIVDTSNLPALFGNRRLVSWSQLPGPGLAVPSAWHEENPAISMSQLRSCLRFESSDWFVNPSTMAPSNMGLAPFPGNSYVVLGGTTRPATMTTAIMVTSSNIHQMKSVFGEDRRMITGIPHTGEFQRMEAALLMTFHLPSAHAQISQQAITFSTARSMGSASSSPVKNPSRMFRQPATASSSRGSPFASALNNIQGSGYVPVLDARNARFSVQKLVGLDTMLPSFNAEVPEGSLAWVGYTVNKYTTNRGNHLNFNLMWVVVLGTPE
ncbi:hypothetical protein HWV62_29314 [Athelia sp. TMB]|nr:hypothetical protein HWV62_29314 [Athelia sp. TMB]